MISLHNISKNFGNNKVLSNINLSFNKKHEIIFLIGQSGSGKSTLMRCINHLEKPSEGYVKINNNILNEKNKSKLCIKIGMVFQNYNLFPHLKVIENLTYASITEHKINKTQAIHKASQLLQQFSLIDKMDYYPHQLSGGQQQRVAICRALMLDPEIMLFDEPVSAIDPEIVKDIIQIILALKKKMTMIIITHNMKFMRILADRIIFLDKGMVLTDQLARDFFSNPASERAQVFLNNISDLI